MTMVEKQSSPTNNFRYATEEFELYTHTINML